MQRLATLFCATVLALLMTGCSTVAPQYASSLDNVSTLKNAPAAPVKVGTFGLDSPKVNSISLRGTSMASPYQDSYPSYLAEALKQELTMAQKYSADASTEITGTLLKNDIDAAGISTADGIMEARVVVKNRDAVKYDKLTSVKHEWESSFVGGIAIPRAVAEYPTIVRKFLTALYADPDFIAALK